MKVHLGQIVKFSKVPSGSYTSPNIAYLVENITKGYVTFRNVLTGGATQDAKWAIAQAEGMIISVTSVCGLSRPAR